MAAPVRRAQMAGDPLSLVENLDRLVGDPRINQFFDEAEGRRIPMAVDLDVVVGGDAAALPDRESVGLSGVAPVSARHVFGDRRRPSLARSSASETRLTQPVIEGARSGKLNSAPNAAFRN